MDINLISLTHPPESAALQPESVCAYMNSSIPTNPTSVLAASELIADVSVLTLGEGQRCKLTTVPVQEGVELLAWQGRFDTPLEIGLEDDSNRVHFTYPLEGNSRCWFEGGARGHEHYIRADTGSINFGPGRKGRFSQSGDFASVTVMVRPDVFEPWLAETDPDLRAAIIAGRCFAEGHRGSEMRATAHALMVALHPKRVGELAEPARHRLWLQAQALALVGLFLEGRTGEICSCGVEPDLLLLQRARDRLLADLSNPPTLAQLSDETGLSMLKLKRGFRRVFGNSVYGLFQHERMHDARRRLSTGRHSVMHVATEMGYSNASHFAAAFKKQFGVNPADMKRGILTT